MKKPALRLVTVLAVLALVGAACGGGGNKTKTAQPTATTAAAGTPQTGGTLRVGLESDVSTLDPAKGLAQPADKDIGLSVYDPLMSYDKDGIRIAGPINCTLPKRRKDVSGRDRIDANAMGCFIDRQSLSEGRDRALGCNVRTRVQLPHAADQAR